MHTSGESIRNLQAISSPGVGGREILPPVFARELAARGQPTWLLCRPETLTESLGKDYGLALVPTRMRGYFDPGPILGLARFLRRERIQLIHAHWSRDLANLLLAARLAGRVPVVLTKHVYSTETKRDPFHDWVYGKVAAAVAVSQLVETNLAETTALPPYKITTIYNGIDLQTQWNPERVAGADRRRELGVPAGAPILCFAGRMNRGKGPHLVLAAFAQLAADFPDWHLLFVGRAVGDQEEAFLRRLRADAAQAPFAERVHFAGFRDDMPELMSTADLCVCASEFETFGMVVVEAMAMARPVVGPDSGGVPEIIQSGRGGLLFHAGDTRDLAAKLAVLMADPQRRLEMGRIARRVAEERFSIEGTVSRLLDLFGRVLSAEARD